MEMVNAMEWLDRLITIYGNLTEEGQEISQVELGALLHKLSAEKSSQMAYIRSSMLSLPSENSQKSFITNYYNHLNKLLDLVSSPGESTTQKSTTNQLSGQIKTFLTNLTTEIYRQYSTIISLNSQAPDFFLQRVKSVWRQKLPAISAALHRLDPGMAYVILNPVHTWLRSGIATRQNIGDMVYFSKLLHDLELWISKPSGESFFSNIEQYLIQINFNSHHCFDHLTIRIAHAVNQLPTYSKKLDQILLISKELNQQLVKLDIGLNPKNGALRNALERWISQEIIYLERKLRNDLTTTSHSSHLRETAVQLKKEPVSKVLCMLTVDQMAILLRAADESKLLNAKSISAVYKQITPYLSSPFKDEISPDSMRSKSYVTEDRDKEIVIEALHKLVKKIEQF